MEAQRFQGELEGTASTGKVKKKKKKDAGLKRQSVRGEMGAEKIRTCSIQHLMRVSDDS